MPSKTQKTNSHDVLAIIGSALVLVAVGQIVSWWFALGVFGLILVCVAAFASWDAQRKGNGEG